ncbi:MAG: hypothetical protein HGJ94_18385 [Desulfosarcina sp.]|nr:hypothetical protein [Desulfosarcina sp.]
MSQFYIGVKIIEAWKQIGENGEEGYAVKKYPDGHVSWSPKDVLERTYFPMGQDPSKITENMVSRFIDLPEPRQLDDKTTLVKIDTITGFVQYEVSSCVDPTNYDQEVGTQIAMRKIRSNIWKCLGFVLQWGRFGLKNS